MDHDTPEDSNFEELRKTMVLVIAAHAVASGEETGRPVLSDAVMEAMFETPRHRFVPEKYRTYAYDDCPLPIGYEKTISQPFIVALMIDLLDIEEKDRVLEIGTGSGYQAAVLSLLAKQVYSIEIVPELMSSARELLGQLGYDNVTVLLGDGNLGLDQDSPYDAIIVTAAAPRIPPALIKQLAEGGRLVLPVVRGEEQHLLRLRKRNGRIVEENLGLVRFVPLVGGDS